VAPQVHIKARFIQVEQDDNAGLGFDWYLGQFNIGHSVAAQGGSAPSLNVPGPGGTVVPFPGPTGANAVPSSGSDQQIFGAAAGNAPANANLPTLATITGILTNPNFRVVLHALEQRSGFEELAEPEVTTTSGRQTEMRATQVITVITGFSFQQGTASTTTGTTP
jgi:general secretion pathway protein D